MTDQIFAKKMASKSTAELEQIIASESGYVDAAKAAARQELLSRGEEQASEPEPTAEINLNKGESWYENQMGRIKTRWSFNWTPKHSISFSTRIPNGLVHALVTETFQRLKWDVVYADKQAVEAKRPSETGEWTEKISVRIGADTTLMVTSKSLGKEMLDFGRNAKLVQLFRFVFNEVEQEYDAVKLAELEQKIKKEENWEDYKIPDNLPLPAGYKKPSITFPMLFAFGGSLAIAALFAALSQAIYIIVLYEVGAAFALAWLLSVGIKAGNFTEFPKLKWMIIAAVILLVVANQYFQFLFVTSRNNITDLGFADFIQMRLGAGFTLKTINFGSIGWMVVWALQVLLMYWICTLQAALHLLKFQATRVPVEIIDFAFYHFVKGKSEDQVRNELSKVGWKQSYEQDSVLGAVGAVQELNEIRRE